MDFDIEAFTRKMQARAVVEKEYEWRKWMNEIPELNFPSDWGVRIIPPFGGAVARFRVNKGTAHVSVYLDCYEELGMMGQPYWELYPSYTADTQRCYINETDDLIEAIDWSLKQQLGEPYVPREDEER